MVEITLKLKAQTQEKSVTVDENETVKKLRDEAALAFGVVPARVCLIYAGKILKDENTLIEHKLQDGLTVHVVIKNEVQGSKTPGQSNIATTSPTVQPSQGPPGSDFGSLSATAASILSGANNTPNSFASMQQALQNQVMRNPELLQNMMESPLVQSLMSNPAVMQEIMQSNPQIRELMERNPELNQMLSNPELMRQSMEIASNPAMMQEMMRSYDRAVLNLESIPGGGSHLQRIYETVQEPMLNALQENDSNNPFADLAGGTTHQAAPTNEPMPNPWAPTEDSRPTNPASAPTTAATTTTTTPAHSLTTPTTTTLGGVPFNPEAMSSAFQTPYVRQLLESMSSSPETMEALLSTNPLWGGAGSQNPETREQLRRMLPQLSRQMSQPGFINMMSNPRALSAMAQIQDGLRILQSEAPDVFASMTSLGSMGLGTNPVSGTAVGGAPTPLGGNTTTSTTAPAPATASPLGNIELATLMASLLNVAPGGGVASTRTGGESQVPPEERYAQQLQTLSSMGFTNQAANLRALTQTQGDVNAAIDRLLGN